MKKIRQTFLNINDIIPSICKGFSCTTVFLNTTDDDTRTRSIDNNQITMYVDPSGFSFFCEFDTINSSVLFDILVYVSILM